MTRARGADFSSWQDDAHIAAALEHGLEFAFVKLTQGAPVGSPIKHHYSYPNAGARLAAFRVKGLVCGVYHFLDAATRGDDQWHYFEAELHKLAHHDELLVALDYEAKGTTDRQAREFIHAGRKAGYRVGLYSSAGTHAYARLGQAWRWVAKWSKTPPPRGWAFWQFAPGRHGAPDWDLFSGDRAKLHAFAAKNAGRGRYRVTFPGHPVEILGPYRTARAAALHALAYAIRHPRRRSYTVVRA